MWTDHANRVLVLSLNIFIGLYLLFTLSHVFVMDAEERRPLIILATLTAVLAAGLRASVKRERVRANAENILLLLIALGTLNSLLHLLVTQDINQSTNLIFVIATCGFLVTNTQRFVAMTVITLVLWIVCAVTLGDDSTIHFAYALLMGTVMAGLLHYIRRQSIQTEYALNSASQLLEDLGSVTDPILVIDDKNIIRLCNEAASALVGMTGEEIAGKPLAEVVTGEKGGTDPGSVRKPDGSIVPVEVLKSGDDAAVIFIHRLGEASG